MISIIVPTLNEEKIIEGTLRNLKKITVVPTELIVTDGKSTDKTAEIARKYTDRVIVHTGEVRQNIPKGKNAGAAAAQGKYLMFFDADCSIPDPNAFVKRVFDEFERDEKLLGATAKLKILKENETLADKILSALFINWPHYFFNNILSHGSSSGEFQFVRREYFEKLNGYDEKLSLGEDNEFFWRLAKLGKTRFFNDLIVYHTGRRFHKVGWAKILWKWIVNLIYMKFFKKSNHEEWTPVR
jgi:glycosyltransferase involved in cell wall biosynthesis